MKRLNFKNIFITILLFSSVVSSSKDLPKEPPFKALFTPNNYSFFGDIWYFYSPNGTLVKSVDRSLGSEFHMDNDGNISHKNYFPRIWKKGISPEQSFLIRRNRLNDLGFISFAEVYIDNYLNHYIKYEYDDNLRVTQRIFIDLNNKIYLRKVISYVDRYRTKSVKTYNEEGDLISENNFFYINGLLSSVVDVNLVDNITTTYKYKYKHGLLKEVSNGIEKRVYFYNKNFDQPFKVEDYAKGKLVNISQIKYDTFDRVLQKDTYSSNGVLQDVETYTY